MARPTSLSGGRTGAVRSSNPISNWLAKSKERRREAAEEAAKQVINATAGFETALIEELNSIDFLHSILPKSVLEKKSNPNQKYCDLENATRYAIKKLQEPSQMITLDIRKFDEKLMTLVLLFKRSVADGNVQAAYAAKGGVVRAIKDIRCHIPQDQPELAKQYVEANAKYLDQWITLVDTALVADQLKVNMETMRGLYEDNAQAEQESIEDMRKMILSDANYAAAYDSITNRTIAKDRFEWTDDERKVHKVLVECRMKRVNTTLRGTRLQQLETEFTTQTGMVDALYQHVAELEIVSDPNRMEKFQESIDNMAQKMAESEAQIDQNMKMLDYIEGIVSQIHNGSGSQRAMEIAVEEGEIMKERIQKLQDEQSGKSAAAHRKLLKDLGILSNEELAERKRQRDEQEQKLMEEVMENELVYEQETEAELLAN